MTTIQNGQKGWNTVTKHTAKLPRNWAETSQTGLTHRRIVIATRCENLMEQKETHVMTVRSSRRFAQANLHMTHAQFPGNGICTTPSSSHRSSCRCGNGQNTITDWHHERSHTARLPVLTNTIHKLLQCCGVSRGLF